MNRLRSTPCVLGLLAALAGCESPPPSPVANTIAHASATAPVSVPVPTPSTTQIVSPSPPPREVAGAQHILVAYKGASGAAPTITRSKADAQKRAEEARKKALDPKVSFEDLVKAYSDDAVSKPAHGMLGNFERNAVPAAFADATFKLPVGGISEVVETPRGFHIIKRTK